MKEVWRDIKGYEGYYQVSNLGHVRSLDRIVSNPTNGGYLIRGKLKKLGQDSDGYLETILSRAGINTYPRIHRLAANAFIPNPDNLPEVNHIDGDKSNNSVDNLEWASRLSNEVHARSSGLKAYRHKGERVYPVRLLCQTTGEEFASIKACADKFGFGYTYLCSTLKDGKLCHGLKFVPLTDSRTGLPVYQR